MSYPIGESTGRAQRRPQGAGSAQASTRVRWGANVEPAMPAKAASGRWLARRPEPSLHAQHCRCARCRSPLTGHQIGVRMLAGIACALALITAFSALTGAPGITVIFGN